MIKHESIKKIHEIEIILSHSDICNIIAEKFKTSCDKFKVMLTKEVAAKITIIKTLSKEDY